MKFFIEKEPIDEDFVRYVGRSYGISLLNFIKMGNKNLYYNKHMGWKKVS